MPALRIANPCSANWADMPGTDKVRHCPRCDLDVYNFSAMTQLEINQIVAARTGRLCARFYQRPDGTMLTENCPAGIRTGVLRGSTMAAAALVALVTIAPANADPLTAQVGSSSLQIQATQQGLALEVRDASGAVIPGAAVSLVNSETGQHFDLTTDAKGKVTLPDLAAGSYELAITASGFSTFREKNLTAPGQAAVTLQVGALMGEVVEIAGIEPSSSEISKALLEPSNSQLSSPSKTPDHRNALQRFFSKLRRLF